MKRIWFKPWKIGYVAAYYPTHWKGWLLTGIILVSAVAIFNRIDALSHSTSDTLIGIAPYFIGLGLFFDLCTRAFGEYPSWWRRPRWRKKK